MKKETNVAVVEKIEDGILRIVFKDHKIIDADSLNTLFEIYRELQPEGAYLLGVFNQTHTAEMDIKEILEKKDRLNYKKGEAFVIEGLANRLEVEYLIQKTKKMYATRVFTEEKPALAWLKQLRNKNL
jgi:hypothetical protein